MRLLSKYWTSLSLLPRGESLYCSTRPGVLGPGPQNQVRLTLPSATGLSVRCQTRWNAGCANWKSPPPGLYTLLGTATVGTKVGWPAGVVVITAVAVVV